MIKIFLDGHGQKWVLAVWSWDSKLAVSQEGIDGMNWFFAWWCKFRNAKSYFNDFWVGLAKIGCGHLVYYETLKSAEWFYGLSWFFACWLWCSNFLLEQHCTFCFWLANLQLYLCKYCSCTNVAVVLVSPLMVAAKILWGSVHSSLLTSECFLWILPGR